MGLVSRSVCWRLLGSVSEHESPNDFLAFYQAVKSAANRKGFNQKDDDSLTESQIQNQIVEAIGRSLQTRPTTLPAVGHTMTVEGECWHIVLHATEIPHLNAAVVERKAQELTQYRFSLVRELIERGNADYGKVEGQKLHGKTWELYLYCKARRLGPLQDALSRRPFRRTPVLRPPNQIFPQLSVSLPLISSVGTAATDIRKFLDECDQVLVDQVGEPGLAQYLGNTSISPKVFLAAQKPGLLEKTFKL